MKRNTAMFNVWQWTLYYLTKEYSDPKMVHHDIPHTNTYIRKGKKTQKGEENGYLQEPETHNVLFILQIFLLVLFLFTPHTPTSFNSTSIFVLKHCFFFLFLFFFWFIFIILLHIHKGWCIYKRSGWNGNGATNGNPEEWKFFSIIQDW